MNSAVRGRLQGSICDEPCRIVQIEHRIDQHHQKRVQVLKEWLTMGTVRCRDYKAHLWMRRHSAGHKAPSPHAEGCATFVWIHNQHKAPRQVPVWQPFYLYICLQPTFCFSTCKTQPWGLPLWSKEDGKYKILWKKTEESETYCERRFLELPTGAIKHMSRKSKGILTRNLLA